METWTLSAAGAKTTLGPTREFTIVYPGKLLISIYRVNY